MKRDGDFRLAPDDGQDLNSPPPIFRFHFLTKKRSSKMLRAAVRKSGALASRRVLGSSAMGATRAMSGKEIKFGVEGRAAMLKGVNTLADAVQVSNKSSQKIQKLQDSLLVEVPLFQSVLPS